ncbi:MAG: L-serine ammonia-lyase, partial [Bifidobacteriaceae bacterium]|nr:L-serine ammonia-lyase [Bifidobacteriaceae bacterium]
MAYISVLETFSLGIGPSSSHTVGPMRAAGVFAQDLQRRGLLRRVERIECELYGSLGATGIGHHTPRAVAAGLAGLAPETIEGDTLEALWAGCLGGGGLDVMGGAAHVPWDGSTVRLKPRVRLERHPNALRLVATAAGGTALADAVYYSVGGGFIEGPGVDEAAQVTADQVPYPFVSAVELLDG